MKFSVLTPTYNRAYTLKNLYDSLVRNNYDNIEWLIMDDGSTDNTKKLVDSFIKEKKINIRYFHQKNQGKMKALNNILQYIDSDITVECDSDDYLDDNFFDNVINKWNMIKDDKNIYGFMFQKLDQNYNVMGNKLNIDGQVYTMFDLYFKKGLVGDKCLIFKSEVRKQYYHKLEHNETFATEGRMYHEMDKRYRGLMYFNIPGMICEYKEDGYTKNIIKIFKENPYAHYWYFKEMFDFNMKGVLLKKRLYIIKHYILFSCLVKKKYIEVVRGTKGLINRLLVLFLMVPGYGITKKRFNK